MRRNILLLILFILPVLLFAQRRNKYRYEWVYGIGATNFLGDLGGADQIGTHLIRDVEFIATRPALAIGYRYKFTQFFALKGSVHLGMLNGEDRLTEERFRNNRNLSFRSPILEFSGQFEGYLTKEKKGHLYRIKNAKGAKRLHLPVYGFVGVGFFLFNPQAKYKGNWVNLQPLGTEGQGLAGGNKKYSRINLAIPMGLGVKYEIDRRWSIGTEIGIRYTFTDYIDDVSTVYYDKNEIKGQRGDAAAYLSDPSLGKLSPNATFAGQQRGDSKHNDAYGFMIFNVNYKVLHKKRTRSKF